MLDEAPRVATPDRVAAPVSSRAPGRARDVLTAALVALASLAGAALGLELWDATLGVPFAARGDAGFYLMLADGVTTTGWHLVNPDLGAPFGQELYDLPHGADNLQFLALRLLGVVLDGPAEVVNVYFLATFPLVGTSAFLVLRRLGTSSITGAAMALLYALAPYHFIRGEEHLLLSGYYLVPVAALLVVRVLGDDPPFVRLDDHGGTRVAARDPRSLWWALGCIALASTGIYYAMFTLVLLALGVAVSYVAGRGNRARLVSGAIAIGLIGVMLAVNLGPSLVYWAREGVNEEVAHRTPGETELYGLTIGQLLAPTPGHRLEPFQALADEAAALPVRSEDQALGLVASIGFLALLAVATGAALRRRRPPPGTETTGILATLTALGVLCGTIGGFSLLFATLGVAELRAWNRISIFLAFFALAALALWLDRVTPGMVRRTGHGWVPAVVVAVIVVGGLGDQLTPRWVPDYDEAATRWNADAAFVRDARDALGPDAAVFQLPYVPFPESGPVGALGPYEPARFALHDSSLEWSFGGMEGRGAEWQRRAATQDARTLTRGLAAAGFAGILVDRDGYPGGADALIAELGAAVGPPVVEGDDGQLLLFDLRPLGEELIAELGAERVAILAGATLDVEPEG